MRRLSEISGVLDDFSEYKKEGIPTDKERQRVIDAIRVVFDWLTTGEVMDYIDWAIDEEYPGKLVALGECGLDDKEKIEKLKEWCEWQIAELNGEHNEEETE